MILPFFNFGVLPIATNKLVFVFYFFFFAVETDYLLIDLHDY